MTVGQEYPWGKILSKIPRMKESLSLLTVSVLKTLVRYTVEPQMLASD